MDSFDAAEVQFGGDSFDNPFDEVNELSLIDNGEKTTQQNFLEMQGDEDFGPSAEDVDPEIEEPAQNQSAELEAAIDDDHVNPNDLGLEDVSLPSDIERSKTSSKQEPSIEDPNQNFLEEL